MMEGYVTMIIVDGNWIMGGYTLRVRIKLRNLKEGCFLGGGSIGNFEK